MEALTAALKNCDGFVLMMGERNILLPNLHTVDDAVLARRILNEVDGNKAIELFTQGSDILIRTPQENFAKPDLHDGIRFTRTIMEAQEHPETVTDRANKNSVPLTHSPDGVAYFPDAGEGIRREAAIPQLASPAIVRVIALKTARAAETARIIEQLYSRALSVAVEERTNSLIIRGPDDVANEVLALLKRLEDATGASQSTGSPNGPSPNPLDFNSGTLKGFKSRSVPSNDPNTFCFHLGTTGPAPSELRQQYDSLERQAQSLSKGLRTLVKNPAQAGCTNCHDSTLGARPQLLDPMNCNELKKQLRDAVQQAFETRQKLQRAELAEFAKRLQGIQQSIEMRNKISQQIIERRVQELLDPNLKWDEPTPASPSSGIMKSEWPVPAIFDRQGAAPTGDASPLLTEELTPEEAVWEVVGIRAGAPLETIVDQGRIYEACLKLTAIRPRSPAEVAGLKVGDAIVALNGVRCGDLNDVLKVWRNTQQEGIAWAMFARNGKIQDVALKWRSVPSPVHSTKTVKIQALLFDFDEKAEDFDLSRVQHDAPEDLEAMLKAAAAKGLANVLSRPQMITRLNQESMLLIGESVPLATNGDQVTSSRDVGVKVGITPREENGKPVLKVAFDFSRVDPVAPTNDPDSTPFIQSNSGELTVRMNEYGGKGKLLGPFKAIPGKHRFLHLIVTLTDDVVASPIPTVLQGAWQFQKIAITGEPNHSPIPEHLADEMKGRPPLVIDGDQMIRTKRDGTQDVYAIQYDSTTTPHRLTATISRRGQELTRRYIVYVNPGYLRLGSTTDGRNDFLKSFDEPRTLVETFKRVPTEPAGSDADSKAIGSQKSSAAQPIKLDDLQGNWRLIITGQATGKNEGTKSERQVLDATIRGNRLTASTNPVQAADNQGKNANSPLRMILHLDGVGDPQPVDLEYVLEASEIAEIQESIDFYPLRNGKPIAQAIIERRGDGFRLCIEHAKIVGRPLAFELGETAGLWELRPIDPLDGEKAPDQPAATSQSSTDLPENSPPLNNRVIPSSDQNSPQAVLDTIRRCQEQKDYAGFVALLSDEEAARMTGIMLQSAVSFSLMIGVIEKSPNPAANPDLLELQKIKAIVDRYTVDDPDVKAQDSFHQIAAIGERQIAVQIPGAEESQIPLPDWNAERYSLHLRTAARVISDQRSFLADMMKAMEEFNPSPEKPAVPNWRLEVNGDQAVATAAAESKNVVFMTPATTQFRKVDGHWRISSLISDEQLMKLIQASGSSERTETPKPPDIQDHSAKSI